MALLKTGLEYAHSKQKRRFDLFIASGMYTPARLAQLALIASNGFHDDRMFLQPRVGQDEQLVDIYKLRTLKHDGIQPINSMAAHMRKLGIDELVQVKNILGGTMSTVGHRPLPPTEYQRSLDNAPGKLVDKYKSIVMQTLPGEVSTFNIKAKSGQVDPAEFDLLRIEDNLRDVIDGSLVNDARIVLDVIVKVLGNKMTVGDNRIYTSTEIPGSL